MELKHLAIREIKNHLAQLNRAQQLEMLPLLLADERSGVHALGAQMLRRFAAERREEARIAVLWQYEKAAWQAGQRVVAGTDEAGRGPLAGPVVAAAVLLPRGCILPGINDSKKLTADKRDTLYEAITAVALGYEVVAIEHEEIDELNILRASQKAMAIAVARLDAAHPIDLVLVDGLPNPAISQPQEAIVKGDAKSISVAAAGILAKVSRDRMMAAYDETYPGYGFGLHKGYPILEHYQALKKLGPSPIHRRSFNLKLDEM